MPHEEPCPHCGQPASHRRNPYPTVDIIIQRSGEILLIERRNPPYGWALPGGFVDYGESLEDAAVREAREETGLEISGLQQFRAYSDPGRDPRQHNISIVFTADAAGCPAAGDDAKNVRFFRIDRLPAPLCFDHAQIIEDYLAAKK